MVFGWRNIYKKNIQTLLQDEINAQYNHEIQPLWVMCWLTVHVWFSLYYEHYEWVVGTSQYNFLRKY